MDPTYTNKFVSDIPLKRPQETFVDDPASLDEVSLKDLLFDLSNDIKHINSLHGFHALAIFKTVLEDLIYLSAKRDALEQFRRQQLEMYSLNLDSLLAESQITNASDNDAFSMAILLPAYGTHELENIDSFLDLGDLVIAANSLPEPAVDVTNTRFMTQEDDSAQSLVTCSTEDGIQAGGTAVISTESLMQTTSLDIPQDPITSLNIERLRREVLFYMSPKIKLQAEHLLKCFSLAKAPPITIKQFLVRIKTYLPSISVSVYIHSAYMLYKLCVLFEVVALTPLNVYRFILALLRCLTKKLEDVHQKQKSFATVGGVALKELCKIEVNFLYLFNFKMVVSERILNQFLTSVFVSMHDFCDKLRKDKGLPLSDKRV